MSLLSLLFVAILISASHASADFNHYTCAGPKTGPVRVIVDDNACRGFVVGTTQHLFSRMTSGTLLASKDGKTVVLIEDYLSGLIDTRRKIIETDIDTERIENPTVLQIWRDGVRVGFFDIARLTKDVTKLHQSTSHVG